jgi:hypothetical protein
MKICTLINGVTLPAFQDQINRILANDESAQLAGLLFVQGTGFVAAILGEAKAGPPADPEKQSGHARRPVKPKARR